MIKQQFYYSSTDIFQKDGEKTLRKVSVKNGKGYKSVTKYKNGKHIGTKKMKIHGTHVDFIKNGKFVPGLFNDCCACIKKMHNKSKNKKTRKHKK